MTRLSKLLTITLCVVPGAVYASEPPALRHNPFSRPPSQESIASGPVASAPIVRNVDDIELNATMVVGRNGLANVAGRVLQPGDAIDGFVLQRVFEDRAIFVRGDEQLTVYVKPDLVESDE